MSLPSVLVVIMVMIVIIVMIVPLGPIFLLLIVIQSAKVPIFPMIVDDPLMVVDDFVIVPAVIVVVVRVVDRIASSCSTRRRGRCEKGGSQQKRTEISVATMHNVMPPCTVCIRKLVAGRVLRVACLPPGRLSSHTPGRGLDGASAVAPECLYPPDSATFRSLGPCGRLAPPRVARV